MKPTLMMCPICTLKDQEYYYAEPKYQVHCYRCGKYSIGHGILTKIGERVKALNWLHGLEICMNKDLLRQKLQSIF